MVDGRSIPVPHMQLRFKVVCQHTKWGGKEFLEAVYAYCITMPPIGIVWLCALKQMHFCTHSKVYFSTFEVSETFNFSGKCEEALPQRGNIQNLVQGFCIFAKEFVAICIKRFTRYYSCFEVKVQHSKN